MAGVDIANQFPNSYMARAVKLGQSRFMLVDQPTGIITPGQINTSISTATNRLDGSDRRRQRAPGDVCRGDCDRRPAVRHL